VLQQNPSRAAIIGGLVAMVAVSVVNRRQIGSYMPEPSHLTSRKLRNRYARRTLHSIESSIPA
jgi:hypothetical protein